MGAHNFWSKIVEDALVRNEVEEMTRPHVIVCVDQANGHTTLSGPYSDGFAALVAAELEQVAMSNADADCGLTLRVQPLLPPMYEAFAS